MCQTLPWWQEGAVDVRSWPGLTWTLFMWHRDTDQAWEPLDDVSLLSSLFPFPSHLNITVSPDPMVLTWDMGHDIGSSWQGQHSGLISGPVTGGSPGWVLRSKSRSTSSLIQSPVTLDTAHHGSHHYYISVTQTQGMPQLGLFTFYWNVQPYSTKTWHTKW